MKIRLDWDWEYLEEIEREQKNKEIKNRNDKEFRKKIKEQKNQSNRD